MVFSRKFRYLFIEVPLTGSWTIHLELCKRYGGEAILHKHASYQEFVHSGYFKEISSLFAFATIRNPLDEAVSRYFKYRSDHKGVFSNPNSMVAFRADYADLEKFQYIQKTGADFSAFFLRYYRWPYSNMLDYFPKHLSYLMRFEQLQTDFNSVLSRLCIEPEGDLPRRNKTDDRDENWKPYYSSAAIERAKKVMAPFMAQWGYHFPKEWGEYHPRKLENLEYRALNQIRMLYSVNARYKDNVLARQLRRLMLLYSRNK